MSEKLFAALAAQTYGLVALGGTLAVCLHFDRGVGFALFAIFFGYVCQMAAAIGWSRLNVWDKDTILLLANISTYGWGLSVCFVLIAVYLVWLG